MYLFSRVRSSAPGLRTYIRATANPGGPGHPWVKARFVTAAKPETRIIQDVNITLPNGKRDYTYQEPDFYTQLRF